MWRHALSQACAKNAGCTGVTKIAAKKYKLGKKSTVTTKKGYKAYLKVSDVISDVISDFISNLTCIDLSSLEGGRSY